MASFTFKDQAFLASAKSTAFSPPDPGDLVLWLTPEALTAIPLANNDPIDTWPDSSGNGNDFMAENTSFRPLYKTNQIGGHPAADFDGADDFLKRASALGVTQTYSLFIVFKFDNAVPASGREWLFKNGEGFGHGLAKWDGNRICFYNTGVFLTDNPATTSPELWSSVRTSAPLEKLYVNGVLQGITNDTSAMTSPDANSRLGIFLNTTFGFDGKLSEVMLWKKNLSDPSRNIVEAHLMTKYGL